MTRTAPGSGSLLSTRTNRRRAILYAVLLGLSLLLLAFGNSGPMQAVRGGVGFALAPVQRALSSTTRSATSIFTAFAEVDQLRQQNRDLEQRNQALEVDIRRSTEIRRQYEQVVSLLQLRSALEYQTVPAEIIARNVHDAERVITIDQGTEKGISVRDVVVAQGAALVGRVVEVGQNFSRVLLISDTRSTVIGLVESSRATGDVQGQLGRPLVMSRIPSNERMVLNDSVVTAGIDLGAGVRSPFPKGLLIGRVIDIRSDPNAVVQTAYIQPAAPLEKLEYVLVITDYEGGIPVEPGASPSPGASAPATTAGPEATQVDLPTPPPTPEP